MRQKKYFFFFSGYLLVMFLYWLGLQLTEQKDTSINLMYSFLLNSMGLIGGVLGIRISKKWGWLKSAIGRGIFFLSCGLISWGGLGGYVWSFYNFILKQEVPYPSLADIGFVGAIPLWITGIFYLSKATGAKFSLKRSAGKILLILIPIVASVFSYYALFVVARDSSFDWQGGILKILLDLFYPIGDWIILTFALMIWGLSLKYLGGIYKWPIYTTIFGIIIMFFADFSFSYTTTLGTYYNGNYADLFFTLAMFTLSIGIANFDLKEN